MARSSPELITKWGWGRPKPPRSFDEVMAWKLLSWKTMYALDFALSFLATYAVAGLPHTTTWSPYAYFTLLPALLVLFFLPCFAIVMVVKSWQWSPNGPSTFDAHWVFKNPAFERRWKGSRIPILTLYEAYFSGDVDLRSSTPGKEGDLLAALYERDGYARFVLEWEHVKFFIFQFIPELLTHSRVQDVEQVRGHYDRGDDFYEWFLGPTMIYTSGIFNDEEDTLEQAQVNKMNLIANKLHLKKGESHLDLGCGWGTFIAHCAKNFGTDSTGITLGLNQTKFANDRCKQEGVASSARALCTDYRDVPEKTKNKKFDKISCLEMSEHVGVKYYPAFVQQVSDMLDDDGLFFLQIAGLRRPWQYEDLLWGLFMGKYVFPGADASCPLSWVITQLESGGFEIHSVETIGIHYSATIKRWYDNWRTNEKLVTAKYGQRWFRLWLWFLAWAVISPEFGMATCYQIIAHKNTSRFDRKQFIAERKYYKI